jgi:hypothetical protein
MRWFVSLTILGTLALAGIANAQSLAEHAAAAAGATVGTAGGKPLSNALGKIFGDVDKSTASSAGARSKAAVTKPVPDNEKIAPVGTGAAPVETSAGPSIGAGAASDVVGTHTSRAHSARARPAASAPLAPIPPPTPVVEQGTPVPAVKEPSVEELSSLHVGATEKEMLAALGVPESRVSIPDDDGPLRESCQYWAQGRPLGTVRLDNGQVVQVDLRNSQ